MSKTGTGAAGASPDIEHQQRPLRKVIIGVAVGNFMEWYDYAVYGFLAVTMAMVFFPGGDSTSGIIGVFVVFGVGYFARPIGGLILGPLADRVGRRAVLAVVIIAMGIATALIGLLPSYASIGIWSTILLIALRMIQGFSAAGEFGTSVSFLIEYAPRDKRALMGSVQAASSCTALMTGAIFVLLLQELLTPADMLAWGWRVPFLIGAPLAIAGLMIRLRLADTPEFQALKKSGEVTKVPFKETFGTHGRSVVRILCLVAIQHVMFYAVLVYMTTYVQRALELSPVQGSLTTVIATGVAGVSAIAFCALSDRIGRRRILIAGCAAFVLLPLPVYVLMNQSPFPVVVLLHALLAVPTAIVISLLPVTGLETLPTRVRVTGFTVPYNLAGALFGGPALVLITWLIDLTTDIAGPILYIVPIAILSFVAALTVPRMLYTSQDPEPRLDIGARGHTQSTSAHKVASR